MHNNFFETPKPIKNLLLLSGSKAVGNLPKGTQPEYLGFAKEWILDFFKDAIALQKPILFVPYARAGGKTEEAYFTYVESITKSMGIHLICAPVEGITEETLKEVGGIFVGGGHTYTLLTKLQQTGSLDVIREKVEKGLPYLGSSAGSIITCPTVKTCNDMPCPSGKVINLESLGLIDIQLNCHYMDNAMHNPEHQGETRDMRLKEFCAFNENDSVLGLYEGTALRVVGDDMSILTSINARGTKPPVFCNDSREEILCEINKPEYISDFLRMNQQAHSVKLG